MAEEQDVIIEVGSSNFVCPFAFQHDLAPADGARQTIYLPLTTRTFPATDIAVNPTNEITISAHGFGVADQVQIASTGTMPILFAWDALVPPTPLSPFPRNFFVIPTGANTFKLALTAADARAGATSVLFFTQGTGTHKLLQPPLSAQRPFQSEHPGVRVLTPRRPYSTNISRSILVGGSGTTLDYAAPSAAPTAHSWVYIRTNSTGQGNLCKVAGHSGVGPFTLTVTPAWNPAVASDGVIHFLQDSLTIDTIDATRTIITRMTGAVGGAADAPDFGSEVDGKQIAFFHDDSVRLVVSHGNDTLTLDKPLLAPTWNLSPIYKAGQIVLHNGALYRATADSTAGVPPPGGIWSTTLLLGCCVLTGANAVQTFAGLQVASNYTLKDLTWFFDMHAPVFLVGDGYQNFDSTTWQSPRIAYNGGALGGPLVNLVPELSFHVRSRLERDLVVIHLGVGKSVVSPRGAVTLPTPAETQSGEPAITPVGYFSWYHGLSGNTWHPSQTNSLFTVITQMFTACKSLLAAEGKVPKVRLISANLSDNDLADEHSTKLLGKNLVTVISALRNFIGDQSIPVVFAGPSGYGSLVSWTAEDLRPGVYEQLLGIVETNAYTGVLDTRGYPLSADGGHYNAAGQIKLGQGLFSVWDTIQTIGVSNTAVDICNLALSHIGERAQITSLDATVDTSAQARHCRQFFDRAINFLLEQHSWDFNTRRKPLVLSANPSAHLLARTKEWTYAYDLPHLPHHFASSLAVLADGSSNDMPPQPYVIETDLGGNKLLLTDVQGAVLRYTVKVTNPQHFSESFIQAASWMLASMLAGPITKNPRLGETCLARALQFTAKAAAVDGNQRQVDAEIEAPWMPGGSERRAQWRLSGGSFPLSG